MKRILSLVLVLVLVLSSLPVFADTMSYGEKLFDLGLIKGDENGNLNESNTLNRAEMMVILSRLYGVEDEAKDFLFPSTFTDVSVTSWYSPYVSYAQFKGWTKGYGDGTFGPTDTLTSQQATTFLLRTLGYNDTVEFEYANALQYANNLGINAMVMNANAVRRGEVFELMFDTINTENNEGVILGEALGVLTAANDELDVQSIIVNNLKEVRINFNKDVDENTAEDEDNYDIDGYSFEVELLGNDSSVLLTLDTYFENQEEFELEIDGVEAKSGPEVIEDYVSDMIVAFDVTIPVAQSIELMSATSFEITFSEPLDPSEIPTVEIENDTYSIDDINLDGSNVVEVILSAELPDEDNYDVEISDAYDYAGLKAMTKTLVLKYESDSRAPEAVVDSADETEVVLMFNEDVFFYDSGDNLASSLERVEFFYHSYTAYTPDDVTVDGREVTLDFTSNPLPEGRVKVVLDFDAGDGSVQDSWGNALDENIVLYADVEADDIDPRVIDIETDTDDPNTILLYFSEDVLDSENEDNYLILDEDDEEVDISDIDYFDGDDFYVEIETVLPMEGDYTIKVMDITDASVSENEIKTVTLSFSKEDETPPSLNDVEAEFINGDEEVYVYVMFPENMSISGTYSVLNKDNYIVDGRTLDSDDSISLYGGRDAVKITIEGSFTLNDGDDLEIARMADEDGNLSTQLYKVLNMYEVESLEIISVKTLDKSHLEIEFNGELDTYSASAFTVTNNGSTGIFASVSHIVDDGHSIITGALKSSQQLTSSSDLPDSLTIVDEKLVDDKGQYVDADTITSFEDGYAPSLEGDDEDYEIFVDGEIDLIFDETIFEIGSSGTATFDFDVWVEGSKLTPATDFDAEENAGEIRLTITDDLEVGDEVVIRVTNADYIVDGNDNPVNDFELTLTVE